MSSPELELPGGRGAAPCAFETLSTGALPMNAETILAHARELAAANAALPKPSVPVHEAARVLEARTVSSPVAARAFADAVHVPGTAGVVLDLVAVVELFHFSGPYGPTGTFWIELANGVEGPMRGSDLLVEVAA